MAACTATLFDTKPGWTARVAERNAALLAQQPMRRRGVRTPEVIFTHHIDNSRLVKAADPVRARQMRIFSAAAHGAVLADHGLRAAALQRHRELLSHRVGEAGARPAARRESPASFDRSAAFAARPHRRHGSPARNERAAARTGCPCDAAFDYSAPVTGAESTRRRPNPAN